MADTIRPQTLSDYVGQSKAKAFLAEVMQAAKMRGEPVKHLLFTGSAGTGKTTLANIVANEMGGKFIETIGLNLQDANSIYKLLLTLRPKDILFVDEIHEISKPEALYRAVEDGKIEVLVQAGKAQVTMQIKLPRFTLIGATTDPSLLPKPLRDRTTEIHLEHYSDADMFSIVARAFRTRKLDTTAEVVNEIAGRSRRTPRIACGANGIVSHIADMAQNRGLGTVDGDLTKQAFDLLGIDVLGLTELDRKYLRTIIEKFDGGKVGIETLAATMGEDRNSLVRMVEPYLLGIGLIDVQKGGRVATSRAYKHLGIEEN